MSDDLTPAGAAAVRLALSKVAAVQRAERAEATVERVRALAARWSLPSNEIDAWLPDLAADLLNEIGCRCGCPLDAHVGEIGCSCGPPDEQPCAAISEPS